MIIVDLAFCYYAMVASASLLSVLSIFMCEMRSRLVPVALRHHTSGGPRSYDSSNVADVSV